MANNDWDLDDLLDFHYDNGSPDKNKDFEILDELQKKPELQKPDPVKGLGRDFDAYDEYRRYEQLRHKRD